MPNTSTNNTNNTNNININEITIKLKDFELNNNCYCFCKKKYIFKNCKTMYNTIINLNLKIMEKQILLCRLQRIYKKIRQEQIYHKIYYNISKTFIIVASILSPALTSLNTNTKSDIYIYLWWVVWLLQLGISLIASLSSFLKWDNKYFLFSKYKNKIEQEIWNYLENNEEYAENLKINFNQIKIKNLYNLPLFFKRLEHFYKTLCNKETEIKLNDNINNNNNISKSTETETETEDNNGMKHSESDDDK